MTTAQTKVPACSPFEYLMLMLNKKAVYLLSIGKLFLS